ncbi:MAG TPA: hypothetical protein VFI95_03055 [Terriglobales bacterium]|nr:hypothetical protein [Terriglobales bacterium]
MRRRLPVWLLAILLVAPALHAQINGTRASVTSLGGQFTIFNPPGVRASVTSLGPLGFTPNCCFQTPFVFGRHHRPHQFVPFVGFGSGVLPVFYMPYYSGYDDIANPVDDTMEQAYTPVARETNRGSAAQQRIDERLAHLEEQMDEIEAGSKPKANETEPKLGTSVADQPATVLVFRDGHTAQVKNYAIVGDMLYEFSDGARHKIALADLDVSATQKQNDERGLDFRLPTHPLGN